MEQNDNKANQGLSAGNSDRTAPAFLARDKKDYDALGIGFVPAACEDGLRSTGREGTYEWWYIDSEYHDGTKVVVVFFTKYKFDLKGPAHPTVIIEITLPDGQLIRKEVSEGKGRLIRASHEKCDVLIRDCYIRDMGDCYEIHYQDEGIVYDCRMNPKIKMWRPGTGHWFYRNAKGKYSAWFVAVPAADIDATLQIGKESVKLTGHGYHDHNWGNIDMNKVYNHWYWARVVFDDYTIIACDIIAAKKYGYTRLPVMMIAKDRKVVDDNERVTEIIREDTKEHPLTGKFVDNSLTFIQKTPDGSVYKITLRRTGDTISASLLENLKWPPIAIRLARIVGINPTYTRHIGNAELIVTDPSGGKKVINGSAIWEQMFFGSNKAAIIHDDRL